MQTITPCLWFKDNAKEAVDFYVSVFKNSNTDRLHTMADGKTVVGTFQINGQDLMVLEGGPAGFDFNEAISLFVSCDNQEEVDELWEKLTADGGEESMCGWLKDKYGLSWQIIPKRLMELMSDPDQEKAGRVMQAMLKMQKIETDVLEQAYKGE